MQLGGVEKGVNLSIQALNESFDYKVLTLSNNNSFIAKKNLPYFEIGRNIFFPNLNYLRKEKPKILIASLWKSVFISIIYRKLVNRKVVLVGFVHSEIYFHLLDKIFSKILLKCADAIACDSLNTLKTIQKKNILQKKHFVIPFIFPQKIEVKNRLTVNEKIKFLYTGRIAEIKNLELVFDFFEIFKQNNIPFLFNIYGVGEIKYIGTLKKIIVKKQLQDCVFFNDRFEPEATSSIYSQYHFYIQFSKNEGMAMSVVDAMMNGLIPICTSVGEIQNYVQHNKNGLLTNSNSAEMELNLLNKELVTLINNSALYEQMSEFNKQYFDDKKDYVSSFNAMINNLLREEQL